jgi:hypothetical protein
MMDDNICSQKYIYIYIKTHLLHIYVKPTLWLLPTHQFGIHFSFFFTQKYEKEHFPPLFI